MNRPSRNRLVGGLLTLALVVVAWLLLAPTQIGGRTGYAVIKGNSMEPGLHQGDLVLVRSRSSYGVGDAVLFESATLGSAHVLHRVVRIEGGRFVTRGDNRSQVDPGRFTDGAVVGELWLTVPAVGSAVEWVARPLHLALLAFLLAFLVLAGGREVSRRRQGPQAAPVRAEPVAGGEPLPGRGYSVTGSVLVAGLAAGVLFAALALLAWSRPSTEVKQVPGGYVQHGTFTYDADVRRSAVYPTGSVDTGQAIFTQLVDSVRFAFAYHFASEERASLRGAIGLDAVVSDGDGWSRSLALAPMRPFIGRDANIDGVLDLGRLERVVTRMRALTKATAPSFVVTVAPRVQTAGYAGSTVIDAEFQPSLPFSYDTLSLRLDGAGGEEPLLAPSADGVTTAVRTARVGAGPVSIATADARVIAAVGVLVSLLLVAGSALLLAREAPGTEVDMLHVRYGHRVVDAGIQIPDGRWVSDVEDAESLGVIAEHYDRVILHSVEPGGDVYVVDDGLAVYRYRTASATAAATSVSPAPGR